VSPYLKVLLSGAHHGAHVVAAAAAQDLPHITHYIYVNCSSTALHAAPDSPLYRMRLESRCDCFQDTRVLMCVDDVAGQICQALPPPSIIRKASRNSASSRVPPPSPWSASNSSRKRRRSSGEGPADVARQVTGCNSNQETRV